MPQWTVPNIHVLPGELICDTLERLCCHHLRIDPVACPVSFLGATTVHESEVEQYIFALNVSGLPQVIAGIGDDFGPHHWWNTEESRRQVNLTPGIRRALASAYLLPDGAPA